MKCGLHTPLTASSGRIFRTHEPGHGFRERDESDGHGTIDEREVERSSREPVRELSLEAIHAQRDALLQARDEASSPSAA